MRKLLLGICSLLILLTGSIYALVGASVCHLGDAPLLGFCPTRDSLVNLAVQKKADIREAVLQAGHGNQVASQLIEALCLGQVREVSLPDGTLLATMSWKGTARSGIYGVHTLWNPRLGLGSSVLCWEARVTVDQKTIIWILPKACGNLSRLGVSTRVNIEMELPKPIPLIVQPSPTLCFAPGANQRGNDIGRFENRGSTQSSGELRWYPKAGDTNVNVSGVSGASSASSSSASSSSQNTNINQNNNNSISQAQNVVPVTVVVNTGPGNATGTATGSGNQDASGIQSNNP